MEGGSKKLLDLIPKEREWLGSKKMNNKKLELRLGPPGVVEEEEEEEERRDMDDSVLSLGYNNSSNGFSFLQYQTKLPPTTVTAAAKTNDSSSQHCCTKVTDCAEKKTFSSANNAAVHNSSQKRTAPAPVVGWPPIRSFRKNLASTSSTKTTTDVLSPNGVMVSTKSINDNKQQKKNLFVKINMDGVPIGRKVDLTAYDSYEKLSTAVDQLFRGLLAAQRDSSAGCMVNNQEDEKAITGVLDGSGEYTLVYEDNEGDRMLVGDVPWNMFVSTVKRLRVLKSSEVSTLSIGSSKQAKLAA